MVLPDVDNPPSESALHLLLHQLVDYAGLFPPAALPLSTAIRNFSRYRRSAESWMLGRFIVPVAELEALDEYRALFEVAPPFRFSVLARAVEPDRFSESLRHDLRAMKTFEERHVGRVRCESVEVKLPKDVGDEPAVLADLVHGIDQLIEAECPDVAEAFLEVPWDADYDALLLRIAGELSRASNHRHASMGLKIRTGGLEPALFPSVDRLARFLTVCREAGVMFKATAGLHHPVRHLNDSVGTQMHGFLNVFGSAVLAHVRNLSEDVVAAILADEDGTNFRFGNDTFSWKDVSANRREVIEARRFATSFGSCSFDEPREDLQQLNFL